MDLKTIAKQVIDIWNAQDYDGLTRIYGENATFYDPLLGTEIKGKTILKYAEGIYAAFPDLVFDVKDIAVGNHVVMVEWSQNGTNTGEVLGKPATGRYVKIPAVSVMKFNEKGDILSQCDYWDMKKLLTDLFK